MHQNKLTICRSLDEENQASGATLHVYHLCFELYNSGVKQSFVSEKAIQKLLCNFDENCKIKLVSIIDKSNR